MRSIIILFLLLGTFSVFSGTDKKNPVAPIETVKLPKILIPDSLTYNTKNIAQYINVNYITDSAKVQAVYFWLADHISYNVSQMFALDFYKKKTEIISDALKTRSAICQGYAETMKAICDELAMPSEVVLGYVKQDGFVSFLPHAWITAKVNGTWKLYDPTWGAGGIRDNQFIKKLNANYYDVKPEEFIKTHMPFDPIWQLQNYPLTSQEFYDNKPIKTKSNAYINFSDSIDIYRQQNEIDKLYSESNRVNKNGITNTLTIDYIRRLQVEIENYKIKETNEKQLKVVEQLNQINDSLNACVNDFNEYVKFRNNQFTPEKEDAELNKFYSGMESKLSNAKTMLYALNNYPDNFVRNVEQLEKNIQELEPRIKEERLFVDKYLATKKNRRAKLFYTQTFFGVPVR